MVPAIDIFGITISEPTTTVTDYMITCVAWWCGSKLLFPVPTDDNYARRLFALGFLFIGLGAFLGGTSHGFVTYLDDRVRSAIWKATVYAVGLSMLFAVAGTINGSPLTGMARRVLHGANMAGFGLYAIWMVDHSQFIYVIYHYVPAMLAIALLQVWALATERAASAPWLIAGVGVTLLGAVVQQSGFTLHRHFNHNDLYHVVQIAGLFLLYRGARLFGASG